MLGFFGLFFPHRFRFPFSRDVLSSIFSFPVGFLNVLSALELWLLLSFFWGSREPGFGSTGFLSSSNVSMDQA